MALTLKCKMCGGNLIPLPDGSLAECDSCGTQQTITSLDDEKKIELFNRANDMRLRGIFDLAAGIYENIISTFPNEAEAYWGLCLCKYGIEYVDDPKTYKKVPTCHRSSYQSILLDPNLKTALDKADVIARQSYINEAKEIDRLNKAIIEIANKEAPYDIFICYKETDEKGGRTKDSVRAQEIYNALTEVGYKVFLARVTLEDKLGEAYEPYIFSALNSSKVMLAIGTKKEYYEATWVRNEWSRYLELMETDNKKKLFPCYSDIDAYDLPEEFKNLQAQDIDKIGFVQDLIRNIQKVIPLKKEEPKPVVVQSGPAVATVDSYLKRAFIFTKDSNWTEAEEYFNKVLDIDPENGEAYLGKLMVEYSVNNRQDFKKRSDAFSESANYEKIMQFGSDELKHEVLQYVAYTLYNSTCEMHEILTDKTKYIIHPVRSLSFEEQLEHCDTNFSRFSTQLDCFQSVAAAIEDEEIKADCKQKIHITLDHLILSSEATLSVHVTNARDKYYKLVNDYNNEIKMLEYELKKVDIVTDELSEDIEKQKNEIISGSKYHVSRHNTSFIKRCVNVVALIIAVAFAGLSIANGWVAAAIIACILSVVALGVLIYDLSGNTFNHIAVAYTTNEKFEEINKKLEDINLWSLSGVSERALENSSAKTRKLKYAIDWINKYLEYCTNNEESMINTIYTSFLRDKGWVDDILPEQDVEAYNALVDITDNPFCMEEGMTFEPDNSYTTYCKAKFTPLEAPLQEVKDLYKTHAEQNKKTNKRYSVLNKLSIAAGVVFVIITILLSIFYGNVIAPVLRESQQNADNQNAYHKVIECIEKGRYNEAENIIDDHSEFFYNSENSNEMLYEFAEGYMNKKEYEYANEWYHHLSRDNYKDSHRKYMVTTAILNGYTVSDDESETSLTLKSLTVGDYFEFGNTDWLVLDRQDNKLFVITASTLGDLPYHNEKEDITWKECSLRQYMNETMYSDMFTSEEKTYIKKTDGDYMRLLSYEEFKKYDTGKQSTNNSFGYNSILNSDMFGSFASIGKVWWVDCGTDLAGITEYQRIYANAKGIIVAHPQRQGKTIAYVNETGIGVRPVMWIEIN